VREARRPEAAGSGVGTLTVPTNEAFSRVKIDAQLRDQSWEVENPNTVRFEYPLPHATKAGESRNADARPRMAGPLRREATEGRACGGLGDRNRRSLSIIDAKKPTVHPANGAAQPRAVKLRAGVWGTGENRIRSGAP